MTCGVYLITNKVNGKKYVGSSYKAEDRLKAHFAGWGSSVVWNAVMKYGLENLAGEIVEVCDRNQLWLREAEWMALLNPEYNVDGLTETAGKIISKSTRHKMSLAKLGKRSPMKGVKRSSEFCLKVSRAKKGKPGSFLGKKHTAEAIAKFSATLTGKKLSKSHKDAIRMSCPKGHFKHTEEAKEKIALWRRGRKLGPRSEKFKSAVSASVTTLWANPEYRARQIAARRKEK